MQPLPPYLRRMDAGTLRPLSARDLPPQVGDYWQIGADAPLTVTKVEPLATERQCWRLTLSDGQVVEVGDLVG